MFNTENEIPKHRKKTQHKCKKSDHKHNYLPCYVNYDFLNIITNKMERKNLLATYCNICGFIGNVLFFHTDNNTIQNKYNLSNDDLNNLPTFIINDIFKDKYVDLNQLQKTKRK